MSKYFNYFPKVGYSIEKPNAYDYVTSVVSRFGIEDALKNNSSVFYTYQVRDGETPEIIASKVYGSSERHWIILMMNDIVDPQYDWPLSYSAFNEYVKSKYSTPEYADTANTGVSGLTWSQNLHGVPSEKKPLKYYKVVTKITSSNTNIEKYEVDSNTYSIIVNTSNNYALQDGSSITIEVTKETKNYYDIEMELNEKKRKIKILKSDFVPGLENELSQVFS